MDIESADSEFDKDGNAMSIISERYIKITSGRILPKSGFDTWLTTYEKVYGFWFSDRESGFSCAAYETTRVEQIQDGQVLRDDGSFRMQQLYKEIHTFDNSSKEPKKARKPSKDKPSQTGTAPESAAASSEESEEEE